MAAISSSPNDPTLANWLAITSRFLAGKAPYPTNELVTDIEPFVPVEYLNKESMEAELRDLCPGAQLIMLDRNYAVPAQEYFDRFLEENHVDMIEWVKEYCDCDNISLYLLAALTILNPDAAIGLIIGKTPSGGGHMWVIARTSKGLVEVEPQNDMELDPEQYTEKTIII